MKVLIVGMRGVGIETAKNLALQGVGAITIIDSNQAQHKDLGVNFFLKEDDVAARRTRAEAVAPRLQELNTLCVINVQPVLTESLLSDHSALVLTELRSLEELTEWDTLCRARKVSFLYAYTCGVSTTLFVDHGDSHVVHDPNGDKPVQKLITEITAISPTELLVRYDHPAGQMPVAISGGHFEVTHVLGCTAVNQRIYEATRAADDPVKTVRILSPEPHLLQKTPYISGGLLTEKKVPKSHPMQSFAEKVRVPGSTWAEPMSLVLTDLLNIGSELQQHVSFTALLTFWERKGRVPRGRDQEDVVAFLAAAKDVLSADVVTLEDFELDESFVNRYARYAEAELQPLSAFTGGVLAQEVVKCTGKFTPIPGFMHFSAPEVLPDPSSAAPPAEYLPRDSRYDELASIFGWPFVEQLGSLRYFMVGCGALGCEFVKNFALNGVCCGPSGRLTITDGDRIELSNLTRQFLFREHNVGHLKSRAAGQMAVHMNSTLRIEALELYVGAATENVFNDEFWLGLSGVCNALDNMEARRYVDRMCVKYERSLLESGTMGTSGNVDTICPFKTQTYGDGGNAVEGGQIPICTLRNFPQITDHCIEWARDQFALLFAKLIKNCEAYLRAPAAFEEEMRSLSDTTQAIFTTRCVTSIVSVLGTPNITALVQVAFDIFHFLFRDRILDLQKTFPADKRIVDKNGVDKGPFWGEKKKYPTVAQFNSADESHTSFLLSTACLLGAAVGIIPAKQENDEQWCEEYRHPDFIARLVPGLTVPEYVFSPVNTADGEEGEAEAASTSDIGAKKEELLQGLFRQLRMAACTVTKLPATVFADFEKDDDFNFHIAFVTAAANLRCDNYSIHRTTFDQCKVIAGKIIAAIATTTAAVCGLVILELFKLQQSKPTDAYMNRLIGLATNTFTSFTAEPPAKFSTVTEKTPPSPEETTPDMYDANGKLKDEYIVQTVKKAYPENHTVWDKILCDGSLTLAAFASWLQTQHHLKLLSWDFIIGYKTGMDEDGKKTGLVGVSTPVFPPKAILDPSLLPDLNLTLPQATQAIMRSAAAKPTQEYIKLWKECKAQGRVDAESILSANKEAITHTTSIRDILVKMEALGIKAQAEKTVETRTVTGLDKRVFWVIPGVEAPRCLDIASATEVEYMAALKFNLSTYSG